VSVAILIAIIASAIVTFAVILSNRKASALINNEVKHLAEEMEKKTI
jgi:hypothetical protein